MAVEHDLRVTTRASGVVRTSIYSSWTNYIHELYSEFTQASTNHPGPPYTFGGPWYMTRTWNNGNAIQGNTNLIQGSLVLGGRSQSFVDLTPYPELSHSEEISIGASLWNAARPNAPTVDLPVALGEIFRDGLPSVPGMQSWKEKTALAKNSGGEYLNVEFGWAPFVSDLKKLGTAVRKGHSILQNYRASANRTYPRVRSVPIRHETKPYVGNFVVLPSKANVFATGGGSMSTIEQKVWFVGHFKYYMPTGEDLLSRMYRYYKYANKLVGARLTPDVVWNLAPWSWALDWFADIGTVIENVSSLGPDGVAAFDAYIMHGSRKETVSNGVVNARGISGSLTSISGWEYKRRTKASPFGFGFESVTDFSPKQYSIALALGLSRGGMGALRV